MQEAHLGSKSRAIFIWLMICAGAVFMMALIGAATRLTESGLSIVEWKPVAGALPPLNEADWQREYDLYQQSPQGRHVNAGMPMADFKLIYFWEWFHRLWGRLIGLIYALPLVYFWRYLPPATRPAALGLLALGAAQGAMGWFMVKSGLVDVPAVSHYRLAAHLSLAFIIYALMLRLALRFHHAPVASGRAELRPLRKLVHIAAGLTGLTIVWGAFVAGLDAGLVYNTFPHMNGHWFPPEALAHAPMWRAFIEEPASVQYVHRCLALLTLTAVIYVWLQSRRFDLPRLLGRLSAGLAAMAGLQVTLGVLTLVSVVNIHLAVAHQGGALVLLGLLIWMLYELPKGAKA